MSITSEEQPSGINAPHAGPNPTNRAQTKKSNFKKNNAATVSTKSGLERKSNDRIPLPKISYAAASTSKKKDTTKDETVSKRPEKSFQRFPRLNNNCTIWTEQIKRIVTYHNQGTRTLIIMRGAPGSGKSYLASQIQEMTVGSNPQHLHIYSSDDYFIVNGHYKFEKNNLPRAHNWNHQRAFQALDQGVSPVIIDNTNVEYWEMEPYVNKGVNNGYLIEVVEPATPWARNLHALCFRNKHGVPVHTIKRILEMLEVSITSASLSPSKLAYPQEFKPPVVRSLPKYSPCSKDICSTEKAMITLQEKNIEIQQSKMEVEDNEYFPPITQNIIHSNSKAEVSDIKVNTNQNQQIKYIVEEEGDNIKVKLDIENTELDCDVAIISEQCNLIKYEEKESLNEKIKTLAITEDQNIAIKSELIEQGEAKNELTSNIDDKVEENDFHDLQNVTPPSKPTSDNEDQKVEKDWDNGEAWDDDTKTNKVEPACKQLNNDGAKSPRTRRTRESEKSLQPSDDENDWRKMYTPMTSFIDKNNLSPKLLKNDVVMKSSETCMEFGDTDTTSIKDGYKILSAIARDINFNYVPNLQERIPENRKFDKSSMTNEIPLMSGGHRCKNENKHFIRFRNMFKNLKKEDLRDIFDNCCGDVNWAVNIVMDAMPNNKFECIAQEQQSDVEEDSEIPCDCTSFYGIIPDLTHTNIEEEHMFNAPSSSAISTETLNPIRKQKKDSPLSDSSLALKRQIEQNIVISDQHYSEHFLKIRKMRRGELDGDVSTSQNIATGITMQTLNQSDTFAINDLDTTNKDKETNKISEPSSVDSVDSEDNSDDESIFHEVESTVNINLGYEFLRQLDSLFGRADMRYSDNIEPRINMPMTMLNEINALWMESLMCQLEAENRAHQEMIKEDEEFARELAIEQEAMTTSGKEQEIPNFKEIMDMEYALSLYRKDCKELMQKDRPSDMASKLSTKKLHDLFPEIPHEDLDQILMAHDFNFKTTVGVLLETQGRGEITREKNGVNKFIMAQELERQERFLAAEKKKLTEQKTVELPNQINMETVNDYRSKAQLHFANWNKNFEKAKQLVKKNAAIANYYNSLAGLHLLKFEQANCVAAVSLLQIHAKNSESNVTLDLHYLHVNEAIAALDVFLDSHIDHLRTVNPREQKYPALFVITGRGLHSRSGPRIKPATKKQLEKRGLRYREINPGLLSVKVCAEDKMSHEIT